jgi:hypothetical protein
MTRKSIVAVISMLVVVGFGGDGLVAGAATAATTAATAATTAATRGWWHPAGSGPNLGPEFQWELDHALNTRSANDMGTGARNAAGRKAANPSVYDVDAIDNPASTVRALHRRHDRVICYIEVGAAGNYDEECNFYQTCAIVTPPYRKVGKLVLDAEYTADWGRHTAADLRKFCAADKADGLDGTLFTVALAGQRSPCR